MSVLEDVVEKVFIPGAGALAGWLGKAATTARKLEALEKSIDGLTKMVESLTKTNADLHSELEETNEHLDESKSKVSELERRLERVMPREQIETSLADIRRLAQSVDRKLRNSTAEFAKDAELSKFMTEENERWQRMERSLGQIEGAMRSLARDQKESTPFPPRR